MKSSIYLSIILITSSISYADYVLKYEAVEPSSIKFVDSQGNEVDKSWKEITPIISEWLNFGDIYDCQNWYPNENTIPYGESFVQYSDNCKQKQNRNVQRREEQISTGIVRNKGSLITEEQILTGIFNSRNYVGTMGTWYSIEPAYSEWLNSGLVYDCITWTPSTNTVDYGVEFIQTSNDCKIDQYRTKQDREQQYGTYEIRNVGEMIIENRTLNNQISTRQSIGDKEEWVLSTPTYSDWVNSGEKYDCITWTPDPATIDNGQSFTQTSNDCKQNQTRTKQDREQEVNTLEYRNVGELITETQILENQTNTRESVGTKPTGFAYYRIFIEAPVSAAYSQIVELELLNSNGVDLFDLYSVQTSQSSFYSSEASYGGQKTIDNMFGNNKWTSANGAQFNSWVSYRFPVGVSPKTLTITNYSSTSESSRQPKDFQIQYSSDGVNWIMIKRFTGVTSWAASEKKTFSLQ
jgi:hypothetical protein